MAPRYEPKIYKKQGGAEMVIASGGKLTLESGGAIVDALETASSTAASLSTGSGVTFLTCSSNIEYTLPAIVAGMPGTRKTLIKTSGTTTVLAIINQPTSTSFWAGALDLMNLGAVYGAATIVAGSTTQRNWFYLGGAESTAVFAAST